MDLNGGENILFDTAERVLQGAVDEFFSGELGGVGDSVDGLDGGIDLELIGGDFGG
jgi:hypothetical protein